MLERQCADEQAHRKADTAKDGDPVYLGPGSPLGQLGNAQQAAPEFPDALRRLGICELMLGLYPEGLQHAQRATISTLRGITG